MASRTRLGVIAVLAVGCAADHMPGVSAGPDAGAAAPDDVAPLDCDELARVIDLPGQVAANAGATRGRFPLVLAHGLGGFDSVGPLGYFGLAPAALRARGHAVYLTAVEPLAPTDGVRGPALARQVECIAAAAGADRVNLVGHSQGGLDARWVAGQPDHAHRVASVTTIATPHQGVGLADVFLGLAPGATDELIDALADLYGGVVGAPDDDADLRAAMAQLATAAMADFNQRIPDAPGVLYLSWAGRTVRSALRTDRAEAACAGAVRPNPAGRDVVDPLLLVPFELTGAHEVPNDGLTTVAGARWGTFMGCVPADHLDQVGLLFDRGRDLVSGFDHTEFFADLAAELEARGL